MNVLHLISVFGIIINTFSYTSACKGCLNLDEYNFDKIIPRFEVVLVKFDVAYPYGNKHDVFSNLASEIVENKNFILAQVGVKDYGEKDNENFAKQYGIISKDDLPALRLFVQGEDEPFSFDNKLIWTEENLKKFVRDHTNIYLGLPGCIEQFDKLAIKFTTSKDKEAILKETEKEANKLKGEREKNIAHIYIKFMKKVVDSGLNFVKQEVKRLGKIVTEGKLNEKKKEELSHRLNILKSFSLQPSKSEL